MQDFIKSAAGKLGIDDDTASGAVGSILAMIKGEGDKGAVSELFAKLPGADDLAEKAGLGGSGFLGGIGNSLGKLGGGASGLAGLASSGLGGDKLKDLAKMLVDHAKKIAGDDLVNKVVGSVPALKSLL